MDKAHDIQNTRIKGNTLILTVDGTEHQIDVCKQSKRLASASQPERENFVVSSSGYGIHWPDIDEDLSVDGLIGVKHSSPLLEATA